MARTQFTFTFTNAQPGADVHFSLPVYADATTVTADGPTLVLSAGGVVSVWADAGALIAYTLDGNGAPLSATATATAPSVTSADGTPGQNPFSGGLTTGTTIGVDTLTDPNTVRVAFVSPWGIDSNGSPYYVDGGFAVDGEAAILCVNPITGNFAVVRPDGAVAV